MGRIDQYFQEAQERSKRRKSPWNLVLIPLVAGFSGATYYFLWKGVYGFYKSHIPSDTIFSGHTRLGGILMFLPLFFPAMTIGMLLANTIAWLIPATRKTFGQEAKGVWNVSFPEAMRDLVWQACFVLPSPCRSVSGAQ